MGLQEEGLAAALHQLLGSSASQLAAPQSPSTSPAKTSAPAWAQSLSHAICNQVLTGFQQLYMCVANNRRSLLPTCQPCWQCSKVRLWLVPTDPPKSGMATLGASAPGRPDVLIGGRVALILS